VALTGISAVDDLHGDGEAALQVLPLLLRFVELLSLDVVKVDTLASLLGEEELQELLLTVGAAPLHGASFLATPKVESLSPHDVAVADFA